MYLKCIITTCCLGVLVSCSKDDANQPMCPEVTFGTRFFEITHESGDLFMVWTADTAVLAAVDAQLALPLSERTQFVNGAILEDNFNCRVNFEWSWYIDPADWELTDLSIELCDGNPQFVEENLAEYVRTGRYCPWGSRVLQEVDQPW